MNKPAQSVLAFGAYMWGEGLLLLLVPNILLNIVRIPETSEVWIRLVGVALLVLGYYYVRAARADSKEFFTWTVHMRLAQFGVLVMLVLFGIGHPVLLVFAGIEAASGLWTQIALRYS